MKFILANFFVILTLNNMPLNLQLMTSTKVLLHLLVFDIGSFQNGTIKA